MTSERREARRARRAARRARGGGIGRAVPIVLRSIGLILQGSAGAMHAANRRVNDDRLQTTIDRTAHASDALLDLADHVDEIIEPWAFVPAPEASGEPSAEYEDEEDPER